MSEGIRKNNELEKIIERLEKEGMLDVSEGSSSKHKPCNHKKKNKITKNRRKIIRPSKRKNRK